MPALAILRVLVRMTRIWSCLRLVSVRREDAHGVQIAQLVDRRLDYFLDLIELADVAESYGGVAP